MAKELHHEVTVTLKLIQVYVTDNQGNPVTDLKKSDFELYDNGKRKTLTEFEKHVLFSLPPTKITIEKKTQTPPSLKLSRKFILFFDFALNSAQGIRRAVKAASYLIDTHLIPTDEVSVISYSALRGLTLHSDLTTDHQMIRNIVKRFGIKEVLGRAEDQLQKKEVSGRAEDWFQYWDYSYNIIKYSREIRDLAKALSYVPGQKQIIFFSSGIKYNALFPVRSIRIPQMMKDYEEMSKELAASNCTVHSVYTAASDADMDLELDRDVYVTGRSMKESPKKDIKETGVFSLGRLSEVTGGRYFGSIFQYEKIMEEIQKITASFYVLGYYVNENWDAKYHRIEVKVNRSGCQVHAQKGYFNPKPFARFSKIEKELHLMGLAVNRKSPFGDPQEFPLIALPFSDKEGPNVVILSEIDPEKMREVLAGEVEMVTFIFNPMNEILDQVRIKMDLSNVSEKKNYLYCIFSLEPGNYECCLVLRNLKTGEAAVASSSVSIPVSYSGIHLFKPLVFIPDEEATYIYANKGQKEGNSG
ncbi:MAG: VWA domain-containing protein, partial [Candidatus Aminicenantes bacterium]|nr:VWA domain-containing protein [Candidatus Aminicenantes bacterium]